MYVEVFVNGIDIGNLPMSTFEAIASDVRNDRRMLMRQIANVIWSGWRVLWAAASMFCVGALLVVGWLPFGEPRAFTEAWATAVRDPIAALVMAQNVVGALGTLSLVCAAVSATLRPGQFGFKDVFADRVAEVMRRRLSCYATGDVSWRYVEYR